MKDAPTIKRGFTLVEMIVVVAIMAILAALLFPILVRGREKARESTCLSNQRQLAAAIIAYAGDHSETLPEAATVWGDLKVDRKLLRCLSAPTATNAYVYDSTIAGCSLGKTRDANGVPVEAQTRFLTADGRHEGAFDGKPTNVAYEAADLDFGRHSGVLVASFLDGHADVIQDVAGWLPTCYQLSALPTSVPPYQPMTLTAESAGSWQVFQRTATGLGDPATEVCVMQPDEAAQTPAKTITITFTRVGQYTVVVTGKNGSTETRAVDVALGLGFRDPAGNGLTQATLDRETTTLAVVASGLPAGVQAPVTWEVADPSLGTVSTQPGLATVFMPTADRRTWQAARNTKLTAKLAGVSATLPITIEPSPLGEPGLQGYYVSGSGNLAAPPTGTRIDPQINFADWSTGCGVPGIADGRFSVRWYGRVLTPEAGNYGLRVCSDDGMRVWWDGRKIIDQWNTWGQTTTVAVYATADTVHDIVVEYQQRGGLACAYLSWALPSAPTAYTLIPASRLFHTPITNQHGFVAEYWNTPAGPGQAGLGVCREIVPWVQGVWLDSPARGVIPDFSARWTGVVRAPVTGTYTICVEGDDGIRLYWGTEPAPVIDVWDRCARQQTCTVTMVAGQSYDVRLELRDTGGPAAASLRWVLPDCPIESAQIIPPQYVTH